MIVKPYIYHLLGFSKNTSYSLKQKINCVTKEEKMELSNGKNVANTPEL